MRSQTEDKIVESNRLGIIPGPNESESAFLERVTYCLDLKEHLSKEIKATFGGEEETNSETLMASIGDLKEKYDLEPRWIPLFYSNYKLPFWHGGCAWIFQVAEKTPTTALIQLRRIFRYSKTYLGIYQRQELLSHELVHVGRMMFDEPRYEEFLAYRTAKSSLRAWWGPIIQSSYESLAFFLVLFLIVIADFFLLSTERTKAYEMALWLKAIPLTLMLGAAWRLRKRHQTFNSCLHHLGQTLPHSEKAEAVIYRLKDSEIDLFAQISPEEIKDYANKKASEELRWKVISEAYF